MQRRTAHECHCSFVRSVRFTLRMSFPPHLNRPLLPPPGIPPQFAGFPSGNPKPCFKINIHNGLIHFIELNTVQNILCLQLAQRSCYLIRCLIPLRYQSSIKHPLIISAFVIMIDIYIIFKGFKRSVLFLLLDGFIFALSHKRGTSIVGS